MNEVAIPHTIGKALEVIDSMITTESDKQLVLGSTEDQFVNRGHDGFGRWIRNNWGLWEQEGPLYEWMKLAGLYHPDDMSSLLLRSYWRYKHDMPLRVQEQIQECLNYWAEAYATED